VGWGGLGLPRGVRGLDMHYFDAFNEGIREKHLARSEEQPQEKGRNRGYLV